MSNRPRTTCSARVVATAALLAAAAVALSASACDAAEIDRRPCRATSRRLYEELQDPVDEDDGGGGSEDSGTIGGYGAGDREPDDGQEPADEDYTPLPPPPPVYEKPRRGVRRLSLPVPQKQREKTYERPQATGNGLRATDTALLRGETIELPTYVNVPVTLRCRFVPLDGTDNKFETVVESMYPGHADAPPPPTDSHASQIIRQLMGSVDGWRSAINKSARPVRRVLETRFGWPRAWSANGDGDDDWRPEDARPAERYDGERAGRRGRRPYAEEAAGRQIAARRLAAERQQWFRGARPDAGRPFPERRPIVRGHQYSAERENNDDRQTENRLIEEDRVSGRIDDQQQEADRDEQIRAEPVDGGEPEQEPVAGQREERLDGRTADDVAAEEAVDDEFQLPAVTTESEIPVTAVPSDYASSFGPDAWIETATDEAIQSATGL